MLNIEKYGNTYNMQNIMLMFEFKHYEIYFYNIEVRVPAKMSYHYSTALNLVCLYLLTIGPIIKIKITILKLFFQ